VDAQAGVVLQAQDHLAAQGELVAEGEIILSSLGSEFGGSCISHAGGAGGLAGGVDEQPPLTSSNSSAQTVVFGLRMGQLLGVSGVDGGGLDRQLALEAQGGGQAVGTGRGLLVFLLGGTQRDALRAVGDVQAVQRQGERGAEDGQGAGHCRPTSHSARSAARRRTRPASSRPPANTQRLSSAQAPATSPALSRRSRVERANAPAPTL